MKRVFAAVILTLLASAGLATAVAASAPAIIPRPQSVEMTASETIFPLKAALGGNKEAVKIAQMLLTEDGVDSSITGGRTFLSFIDADKLPEAKRSDNPGFYSLVCSEQQINIYANGIEGWLYGIQTLRQILAQGRRVEEGILIPSMTIIDHPRFVWRGYMLDVARHFSSVDEIKKTIDAMTLYKMNRLHLHLSDSDGWRLEIKKYPKLTEIGAIGEKSHRDGDPLFYTQKEMRDIVSYAQKRGILILPEIDMPGHATAMTRAYPEFGASTNGASAQFTVHPASEKTDEFLKNILTEVNDIFPALGMIHIGGDEAGHGWKTWKDLPEVQKLMKEKSLKGNHQVQAEFHKRLEPFISEQLKLKTCGWDEVAGMGLKPEKTVLFWWRHEKPQLLVSSVENGYDVVICPRHPCYFDFVQHTSHRRGRRWSGFNSIERIYAFPESLKQFAKVKDSGQVLGIQANLWTETTVTAERRSFMTFPRLLAMAEIGWTEAENKNLYRFLTDLKKHLPILKKMDIVYYDLFENSPEIKR